jgi:uncharacterized membrane protein YagU involved in acid resistance
LSTVKRALLAGAIATVPMTVVIGIGRGLGLFRSIPPRQITAEAADEVGLDEVTTSPAFGPVWLGLHVAFGAVSGVGYALVRPFLPAQPVPGGMMYGLGLWAANYLGIMPALGLFPPPAQAGPRRTLVMIVAHLVYGVTLAHRLDRSGRDGTG